MASRHRGDKFEIIVAAAGSEDLMANVCEIVADESLRLVDRQAQRIVRLEDALEAASNLVNSVDYLNGINLAAYADERRAWRELLLEYP